MRIKNLIKSQKELDKSGQRPTRRVREPAALKSRVKTREAPPQMCTIVSYDCQKKVLPKLNVIKAVFRIRIHWFRIRNQHFRRIIIRIQLFRHFKPWNLFFFQFCSSFLPSWIRIRILWPDWIRIPSGSETLDDVHLSELNWIPDSVLTTSHECEHSTNQGRSKQGPIIQKNISALSH